MTALRFALYLALGARFICAQGDNRPEIRGTVTESSLNIGVAGVEITLFEFLLDSERAMVRTPVATASTNMRGEFRFPLQHFGDYYLEAKKETYVASMAGEGGKPTESAGTPAYVDREHPVQELRFSLLRPGEITGRVVDDDDNPVRGLAIAVQNRATDVVFGPDPRAVTDTQGGFTARVSPGQYLVQTLPKARGFENVTRFSEEDLKIVDEDIESTYWPGGSTDPAAATPIPVSPGATSSLGTITVRKVTLYRVHVSVTAADCSSNEFMMVSAIPKAPFASLLSPVVPCGSQVLIRNLKPGAYWFVLRSEKPDKTVRWALADVEVTHENLAVSLTLTQGAEISGRILPAEGVTLPKLDNVVILTRVGSRTLLAWTGGSPDSEGKFVLNLPWLRHDLSVQGLNGRYYVKEIRYNGVAIADGMVTPLQSAPAQNLEIVLDVRPATISAPNE